MNRRARTLPTIPVRHNRIFDIFVMRDGYVVARKPYWYARNVNGTRITGPVPK